ncbi:uncharacterized protein GGS22DRAFT_194853 [Annulohypoxylon maeteangense]|uniref:uncharacterized protein n=1 Tax=Annulohypoxylon maeteangense TaxID=1927788 RepID=UPI0020076D88|nr:uncharacterized protein GGS22DRAFT_194853 [Annulohypoxylon maeteangense]KAI0884321.1 hypothetical protein GGS22DRAFT_194853 [Annulohypoxylon maeteangense]
MSYSEERDILTALSQDASMPIAIVGISGRFPGDATTPSKLWDLVTAKKSARTDVPENRYNIDAFYHPSADHQGSTSARSGHFLKDDVAAFDAPFFRITAQEAHAMDPQQRMALELAYEALESAGARIEDISGSAMGCYMACCVRDYAAIRAIDPDDYPRYEANGSMGTAMIANRISWYFDIKGPSISLDTACSSSLVALHLACQSIRTGETKAALVGATNLILMPHTSNHLSTLSFLSPDGKSMAFDHRANGYSRGEGVSVIVVKSLADALRDRDVIRAVIRGTSVTQDGRTPGINLPSSEAQEALIRAAYANAGLSPAHTGFFEAHGPGTPAGDPLEASAIGAVFGKTRRPDDPLYIGSVKSNIGHLEAGAGIAGLVKSIYALEKGQVPPNIWFEKANPKLDLEKWGLAVPTELLPWPTDGLRRASINSFGYGGTNAHCILDDAYHYLQDRGLAGRHNTATTVPGRRIEHCVSALMSPITDTSFLSSDGGSDNASVNGRGSSVSEFTDFEDSPATPQLLVWSSHEQSGIGRTAASLQSYLKEQPKSPVYEMTFLRRLAYTLSSRRSKLSWSSFVVASSVDEAIKALDIANKPLRPTQNLSAVFVFTGQGAQWFGMGRELRAYRSYNTSLIEATAHLKSLGCEWDLLEELGASEAESRINEPQISQPACTAIQVALVDLLKEWGIVPSVTVGHSSGEIGAAYAKGAISRRSAWTIAYHRGRLSAGLSAPGAMLAAAMGEADAQTYIDKVTTTPKLVVACINSPISVTISGSVDAIDEVQKLIGTQAWCRKLLVKTAYHSPFMQELAEPYLQSLEGIQTDPSTATRVRMFSSVTGQEISDEELRSPQYWVDNMVCSVKFNHAVRAILNTPEFADKSIVMVEVGPHGALQGPIKQILQAQEKKLDVHALGLLTRKQDAIQTTLTAVGSLYQRGFSVDVAKANHLDPTEELPTHLVDLPPFAWNHNSKYWYETALSAAYRNRKLPKHDLLGVRYEFSDDNEPCWRNYLRLSEVPWLRHYMVQNKPILSFSGVLAMVIEAVRQTSEPSKTIEAFQLRDVFPGAPLFLSDAEDSPVETKLQLRPWRLASRSLTTYWKEFTLFSRSRQGDWTQHSTGLIKLKYAAEEKPSGFTDEEASIANAYRSEYSRIAGLPLEDRSTANFYEKFAKLGMQWGPAYQTLVDSRAAGTTICSTLEIPDTKSLMPKNIESQHIVHPATLDSAFQMLMSCDGVAKPTVAKYIERIQISAKLPTLEGTRLKGFADIKERRFDGTNGTVVISDEKWEEPLIIFEGLKSTDFVTEIDSTDDADAQIKALKKLGAYPTWDIDVENSSDATVELLKKTCASAPQTDYSVVYDLEWAAFIVSKRTTQRFSAEDAENMAPHYQTYYNYMKRQCELAEAGKLPCQSPEWGSASETVENEVLARVSKASLEGEMMCRINDNMSSMLLGEVEAWEVMSRDNLLNNMYRYGLSDERTPAIQCEYIKRLSHKRPLRILEVGAGTGSATSRILSSLGPNVAGRLQKYTYTDISGVFFEAASEEFKEYGSMMEFKVLDIEKEPAQQGLEEGSYDLVVAFQVLHATSSIGATLANCRKLLKPGGHLIVTELTNKIARRSVVFGVLSGWWLGDNDGRQWGPELSEGEWDTRLRAQGFAGVDWCFRDREDAGHSSSIMASSVPYDSKDELPNKVVIVTSSAERSQPKSIVYELSSRLAANGSFVKQTSLLDIAKADLTGTRCIATFELEKPLLSSIKPDEYDALKHMVLHSEGTLWLTRGGTSIDTRDPELNMIAGFARTIRGEAPEVKFTTLDLDPDVPCDQPEVTETILKVLRLQTEEHNTDHEFAERNGALNVLRISPDETLSRILSPDEFREDRLTMQPIKQPGRPLILDLKATGELDSFYFNDDDDYSRPLGDLEVEIEVKAVGLDHYDMAVVLGQLWDPNLGVECSGVVTRMGKYVTEFSVGDRVATCALGWYKTFIRNTQDMFQRLPNTMSFEEGASMMISYGTAVYSIFNVARLQAGETVLIHSASDCLGQAAINAAQYVGAEIIATVSSEAEKQYLVENYRIPGDHIFSNKDNGFVQGIKRITNGLGVQVILNSLTGELLRETWHCIAPFGRFIELGMKDIRSNTGLDMVPFANNAIFAGVNLLTMYRTNRPLFSTVMAGVFRYYKEGVIKLVKPLHVFKFSEVSEAFRMLQARKHGGKVVLRVVDDDKVPTTLPKPVQIQLRPDATYIIPGGMGGLGRSLMRWMAAKGARNLVATSRSGAKDPRAQQLLKDLSELGVKVKAFAADVGNVEQCQKVLKEIAKVGFPPIRGAVIMAMNVQDSMFETMGFDAWWAALQPKYKVTWNMHDMLPKDLDFFITMSSAAGQIGSIAQSNYNAGNTYQDAVVHYRRAQGLKATSIDLGWMGEIGFVSEQGKVPEIVRAGAPQLTAKQFLAVMEAAMADQVKAQPVLGLASGGLVRANGDDDPYWFSDARFNPLSVYDTQIQNTAGSKDRVKSTAAADFASILGAAASSDDARGVVCSALMGKLAKSLMMELEDLDSARPINTYGVDSLVAVDIRAWALKELQSVVHVSEILRNVPMVELAGLIASKSKLLPDTLRGGPSA